MFSSQINIHVPLLKLIKYLMDSSDLLPTVPVLLDIFFFTSEIYEQAIYSFFSPNLAADCLKPPVCGLCKLSLEALALIKLMLQ